MCIFSQRNIYGFSNGNIIKCFSYIILVPKMLTKILPDVLAGVWFLLPDTYF